MSQMRVCSLLVLVAMLSLAALADTAEENSGAEDAHHKQCLSTFFPQNRTGFPAFLNCLNLHNEAVEVGVQAGVHASSFLQGWKGKRLRLVDTWGQQTGGVEKSHMLYVDIANIAGTDSGKQHRAQCEARLADELRTGRAQIVALDSTLAAASIPDNALDFLYLDARHDFAGVVADIHAWWPKVKAGGIFAGHDFVDGEFPEGDFFIISALEAVLPEVKGHTHSTQEKNRYPSFFVIKTGALAGIAPREVQAGSMARKLYAERSRYLKLWQKTGLHAGSSSQGNKFLPLCRSTCGEDCGARAREFTPTLTAGSTLRPFACGQTGDTSDETHAVRDGAAVAAPDQCAGELVMDVQAYSNVCLERCNVTCEQREELFSNFGEEILSV